MLWFDRSPTHWHRIKLIVCLLIYWLDEASLSVTDTASFMYNTFSGTSVWPCAFLNHEKHFMDIWVEWIHVLYRPYCITPAFSSHAVLTIIQGYAVQTMRWRREIIFGYGIATRHSCKVHGVGWVSVLSHVSMIVSEESEMSRINRTAKNCTPPIWHH
jgi:hypothetical protein